MRIGKVTESCAGLFAAVGTRESHGVPETDILSESVLRRAREYFAEVDSSALRIARSEIITLLVGSIS